MASSDTLPADPRDTLWHELNLPEAGKTFAAAATIRGSDWVEPTVAATSTGSGSSESVPETGSGLGLRQRLAELPSMSVGDRIDRTSGMELHPGPEFALIDELGRGGMGVVLRAQQRSLDREVAVKRVRAKRKSQHAVEKLLEEARVAGSLEHPNIVPIHALGADERGDPVLIMKRIEGVVWRDLIRQPDHPRWHAIKVDQLQFHLEVLMQVCRALELAHNRRVLHRDVKPENVMVGDFGEVYLLDWGLALRLDEPDDDVADLSASNSGGGFNVVGTPSYMAPEMLTGAPLSERTDVFLVGASLFEVLTGQPLHQGDSLYHVIKKICEREPYSFDESIPAELGAICNRSTALDPKDRFESVAALREAIADYLQHRAAEQLVNDAHSRLKQLVQLRQQGPTDRDSVAHSLSVRKLATECRFGFQQALTMWPGSPRGRNGFERALFLMIDMEIEQENEAAAWALLDELQAPSEEMTLRVKQLSARLKRDRAKRNELEALAREQDISVLEQSRGRHLLALTTPSLAIGIAIIIARRFYGWTLSYEFLFALGLAPAVTVLGLMQLSAVRELRNQVNRRIVWGFLAICSAVLLLRIAGWRVGAPIETTLLLELVTTALGGMMVAVMTDYRLLKQAGFVTLCAVIAIFVPSLAVELLIMGTLSALMWLSIDWLRGGDK